MVSDAVGSLRASAWAMHDYMNAFRTEDAAHLARFASETRDHPVGGFHTFVGFPEILAFEKEFLPDTGKYDGPIGYRPS